VFFGFTSAILFPVELGWNCAQLNVAISSGDFGILKNKRSNVEFASKDLDCLLSRFSGPHTCHRHASSTTEVAVLARVEV